MMTNKTRLVLICCLCVVSIWWVTVERVGTGRRLVVVPRWFPAKPLLLLLDALPI